MKATLWDLTIRNYTPNGVLVSYQLSQGTSTIGRSRQCTISLPKEEYAHDSIRKTACTVSRQHCEIYREDSNFLINDHLNPGSRNGIYINGTRLGQGERVNLRNGDVLKLGDYELEFRIGEEDPEKIEVVE